MGGDEFLVILPGTDTEEAAAISERLTNHMLRINSPLERPVTASIGFASISEANSVKQLVELADQRTYLVKAEKKNHIREQ